MYHNITRVNDSGEEKKLSACDELEVIRQVISAMDSGENIAISKSNE